MDYGFSNSICRSAISSATDGSTHSPKVGWRQSKVSNMASDGMYYIFRFVVFAVTAYSRRRYFVYNPLCRRRFVQWLAVVLSKKISSVEVRLAN